MKKLFACTAALALLTGACFALPASAEETTYRPGDVDMDGKLTAMDASLILDCYNALCVHEPSPLTDAQTALADSNGDGEITLYDALYVLVYGDYLACDVNLDGVVDTKDAELAAEAYTAFQKEHPGEALTWKNIDADFMLSPLQVANFCVQDMWNHTGNFIISPQSIRSFCDTKLNIPSGDVDLDGTVSWGDVTSIFTEYSQQCIKGDSVLNDLQKILADDDHDGAISIQDVTTALSTYADAAVNHTH